MPDGINDDVLAGISEDVAAIFATEDSEAEEPEEQPGVDDEDAEADLDDDELDLDLDDEEQDLEDDEAEDEDPDDEEDDDLDEDEESEDEEDDDLDEDDEEDDDPEPNLHTVKVQGQEFEVTLDELKAGYQRHADYTVKTQQLSDIYNRMSEWYEERANKPDFWVAEIATSQEDPAEVLAQAILQTGDATTYTGQVLKHLVESGEIADELVEALNLQHIAEEAKGQSLHLKVQSLEQQLQQRDQQQAQQAQYQQVEQEIRRQWADTAEKYGLDVNDEQTFLSTLEFARSSGIPNVEYAYVAMTAAQGNQAAPQPKPQKQRQQKAKQAVARKKKTAAMSRKPTGGAAPARAKKGTGDPIAAAAEAALAELGLSE